LIISHSLGDLKRLLWPRLIADSISSPDEADFEAMGAS